jgi:hypothetical protein
VGPVQVVTDIEHRVSISIGHFCEHSQVREETVFKQTRDGLLGIKVRLRLKYTLIYFTKSRTDSLIDMNTEVFVSWYNIHHKQRVNIRESQFSGVNSIQLCVCAVNSALLYSSLNVNFISFIFRRKKILTLDIICSNVFAAKVIMHFSTSLSENLGSLEIVVWVIYSEREYLT